MKTKRIIAACLSAALMVGVTACVDEAPVNSGNNGVVPQTSSQTTTPASSADPNDDAATDKEVKELTGGSYEPSGNAGTIKYLGFYSLEKDAKGRDQCLIFKSDVYGGDIVTETGPSGDGYFEKLSTKIASDDSPDIVTYDAFLYPGTVSKGMFEALDDYIDYNSPLWEGMADIIDSYAYKGKHYYYPHRTTTSWSLNYSKKTIEENNLPDPYELYKNGEWTWNEWRDMMIQFCNLSENNVGIYTTDYSLLPFIATTGTVLVDVKSDGTITNNMFDPNVTRAMGFYETLYRDGVMYAKQFGDWVSPQVFAVHCDELLFNAVEPEWSYIASTENLQNPTGTESDIHDTVSEFAFVPWPRDPEADEYYQAIDTYGFLIPKGAKNISGAVDFINLFRVYDTDPEVIATVREEHIHPQPEYYTEGKYAGERKWKMTWGEQEYDLWREMCDPANFTFVMEDVRGFNSNFWQQYGQLLCDVLYNGDSWTQRSEEFAPVVEATIEEYRF